MKYHLHLVDNDDRYTDYTCGGFDLAPDYIILYDKNQYEHKDALPFKVVSLKSFKYVDIDTIEEEH